MWYLNVFSGLLKAFIVCFLTIIFRSPYITQKVHRYICIYIYVAIYKFSVV